MVANPSISTVLGQYACYYKFIFLVEKLHGPLNPHFPLYWSPLQIVNPVRCILYVRNKFRVAYA